MHASMPLPLGLRSYLSHLIRSRKTLVGGPGIVSGTSSDSKRILPILPYFAAVEGPTRPLGLAALYVKHIRGRLGTYCPRPVPPESSIRLVNKRAID